VEGKEVGFPCFVLELGKPGFLDDYGFDFTYSSIQLEKRGSK
jgi:hypothetical protein